MPRYFLPLYFRVGNTARDNIYPYEYLPNTEYTLGVVKVKLPVVHTTYMENVFNPFLLDAPIPTVAKYRIAKREIDSRRA